MLSDTVDIESVDRLVEKFYAKLLKDEHVGPYFIRALGDDLTSSKWEIHLLTLRRFWLLVMNGEKGYGGDPMAAHMLIGEMYEETFELWLKYWRETIDELFVPEIADSFYKKADILAEQFMDFLEIERS